MNQFFAFSGRGYQNYGMGFQSSRNNQQAFQLATSAHYRQFHEMKSQMPSDVIELFKANEISFLRAPKKKKCRPLDPVANLGIDILDRFDIPNLQMIEEERPQTRIERKQRIALQKAQQNQRKRQAQMQSWNPFENKQITSDPEKTLIVARLSYKTKQQDLKYEFEKYGFIKSVKIVHDGTGKSRGYGFVEFDKKSDFIHAYKQANHRKLQGHKIVVDFQKGRTLLNWRPRRIGGGEGGENRMTKQELDEYIMKKRAQQKKKTKLQNERSRSRSHQRERKQDKERKKQKKYSKQKKEKKDKKQKKDKKEKKQHGQEMN